MSVIIEEGVWVCKKCFPRNGCVCVWCLEGGGGREGEREGATEEGGYKILSFLSNRFV